MEARDREGIAKLFSHVAGRPLWRDEDVPHRRAELLRPRQFWTLLSESPVIYQPMGSVEYHERCSPLGTDALKAWGICLAAAEESGGIVLPPLFWGIDTARRSAIDDRVRFGMNSTSGFRLPGTAFSVRDETLQALLTDIVNECRRAGAEMVVLLTGHNAQPQEHMIRRVEAECNQAAGREIVYATNDIELLRKRQELGDVDCRHGGQYEALMAEAHTPGSVDLAELPADPADHVCGGGFVPEQFDPEVGRKLMARAGVLVGQQVATRLNELLRTRRADDDPSKCPPSNTD